MTREEHIKWCKERAIQELDFYKDDKEAIRNCINSIMSDLTKHPETRSETLMSLCMYAQMTIRTREAARVFINGFN